jgi:hypothetical protein
MKERSERLSAGARSRGLAAVFCHESADPFPSRKMKEERFLRFSMESLFELGIIDYMAQ